MEDNGISGWIPVRGTQKLANHDSSSSFSMCIMIGKDGFNSMRQLVCGILFFICTMPLVVFSAEKDDWRRPHDYYVGLIQDRKFLDNVEKYHLPKAIESMKQKKYGWALDDLDFVLRYFPNHPIALMKVSELAMKMQDTSIAMKYFEKALSLYSQYPDTHIIYGVFLQKIGKTDEAIEKYKKALQINPNMSEAHYNLGLAYFEKKNYVLAKQHAIQAYQLGYPLPGLRNKLKRVQAWREEDMRETSKEAAASAE